MTSMYVTKWMVAMVIVNSAFGFFIEKPDPVFFECPENHYMSSFESKYIQMNNKKQNNVEERGDWNFECLPVQVTKNDCTCGWTVSYVNIWEKNMHFSCNPGSGRSFIAGIAGIQSFFQKELKDRIWKVKCCESDEFELANCEMTGWLNKYHENMAYTVPTGNVITAIESKYSANKMDRRWNLEVCSIV